MLPIGPFDQFLILIGQNIFLNVLIFFYDVSAKITTSTINDQYTLIFLFLIRRYFWVDKKMLLLALKLSMPKNHVFVYHVFIFMRIKNLF